jgi:hypothetical protein
MRDSNTGAKKNELIIAVLDIVILGSLGSTEVYCKLPVLRRIVLEVLAARPELPNFPTRVR